MLRICIKCNYEWNYKGKRNYAYCSQCGAYNKIKYNYLIKNCKNCKKEFTCLLPRQIFCSFICRQKSGLLKESKRHKLYYLKNKEKIKIYNLKRYYKKRPEIAKYQIHRMENIRKDKNHPAHYKYIARHKFKKKSIKNNTCEICGSNQRLERHHWRYDKPRLINILCKECHKIQHHKNNI